MADKNGWTLAEACGDGTSAGMQRLLNAASWDVERLHDDVRSYVTQHFGQANGVLIVDLCRPRNYADPDMRGNVKGRGEVGFWPPRAGEGSA